MRLVGRLIAGLLALVLVLAAVAYLLPREITVTRDIVAAAPPAQVFPHIDSLQKAAEWSPWTGLDPSVEVTYAGPDRGVGNRMTWSSDDPAVGNGSQEIMVSIPDERIETALDFGALGMATAWQVLQPEGDGTRVTWGLQADTGNSPLGRYMGLMMDRWVGSDFETGLANLKTLVEAG
jgi:hypothetical protein